jgi:hypothetical protein
MRPSTRPQPQAFDQGVGEEKRELVPGAMRANQSNRQIVTPGIKVKSECIEYMCVKIKLHTCIDSVNTKNSVKSV